MTDVIIDEGHDIPRFSPVCGYCERFHIGQETPEGVQTGTCRAFPRGIPMDIWIGEDGHRENRAGDNGLTFQRIKLSS